MEIWFINTYNNTRNRKIADINNIDEYYETIENFLVEHKFKSYYQRLWIENNELWNDVGSHTEFFVLKEPSVEFLKELGGNFKWQ